MDLVVTFQRDYLKSFSVSPKKTSRQFNSEDSSNEILGKIVKCDCYTALSILGDGLNAMIDFLNRYTLMVITRLVHSELKLSRCICFCFFQLVFFFYIYKTVLGTNLPKLLQKKSYEENRSSYLDRFNSESQRQRVDVF